jgi:hypothetical protein
MAYKHFTSCYIYPEGGKPYPPAGWTSGHKTGYLPDHITKEPYAPAKVDLRKAHAEAKRGL